MSTPENQDAPNQSSSSKAGDPSTGELSPKTSSSPSTITPVGAQATADRQYSARQSWTNALGKRAPNLLTLLRFLAVPVFVFLMIDPTPQSSLWATVIFIFAAVTDWLDGYLARIFEAESILGKLLDPLADKILVMAALVMLAALPSGERIPAWIVVVLLTREMLISGLRSVAAVKGIVVAASTSAKHKTAWTFIAIIFLLIGEPYDFLGMLVDFHGAGMIFLYIALVLALTSGFNYAFNLRSVFTEEIT